MLITNHVLCGGLVGLASPGPATAFGAGVVSHFAMDAVPHWGPPDRQVFLRVAVVDGLVGLATMTVVATLTPLERRATVVAGMLGACFPDTDKPAELFFARSPFPAAVDRWHASIQRESPSRMAQEFAVAAAQLVTFSKLVRRAGLARPRRARRAAASRNLAPPSGTP